MRTTWTDLCVYQESCLKVCLPLSQWLWPQAHHNLKEVNIQLEANLSMSESEFVRDLSGNYWGNLLVY